MNLLPRGQSSGRNRMPGLPLALMMLLAGCGGGGDGDSPMSSMQSASKSLFRAFSGAAEQPEAPLTPIKATATSRERGDLDAQYAIDGDRNTRWGSEFTDQQHFTLEFAESAVITRVRIDWENAHARDYELQVSEDGDSWTTIKTVNDSQGGVEDLTGLNGQGKYLRVNGLKRAGQYGYSILEIQAFTGTPAEPGTPPTTPDPEIPIDLSKPGVIVKPAGAVSSEPENGGLSASMAIDGKLNTRWASKPKEDNGWIQFDFASPTPIGYMKLHWENSYAKEYSLSTSNDGKTWTELRVVSDGKGKEEEFFNLNAVAKHVRLQGLRRATDYGYSLWEVEFKTPGSDNTVPEAPTSAVAFPANGNGLTPLPGSNEALESLQFTLADGTLVTRFGARGKARHGRERGEEWNEIGSPYPNQTVDPATGQAVDKGPGNHLTFVPLYYKNRTWGVEIIDRSRVPNNTRPVLTVNQYTTVPFLSGGVAFFRGFDQPNSTGYGWMAPGQLVNDQIKVCPTTPYPRNNTLFNPNLANGDCTLQLWNYPGHTALNSDGFPNGTHVPARRLVAGDVIEVSPSYFTTQAALSALGDTGNIRYYSTEWTYVVGEGLRPWYGVQPRLMNAPLPFETLSGGIGSVSYNYSDNGAFMFQQPYNNVGMQNMQRFVEGRRLLHTSFSTGEHNESGNEKYQAVVGLQGKTFGQETCVACHANNGRSPAPVDKRRLDSMSVRVATIGTDGAQLPHPVYGATVQMNALSSAGTPQNWGTGVRVDGFETKTVALADGTVVTLSKPKLKFDGPAPSVVSLRSAQPMIGVGLLEAVPEADILARVRTTPDQDGVKGTANFVFNPETGAVQLGRFGWKASKATLRHQTASALLQDMSVTSPVYPSLSCDNNPAGCATAPKQRGISETDLTKISHYLALLAVPAQRSLASGFPKGVAPIKELDVDTVKVAAGAKLFEAMRCVACHTPSMKTGSNHLFAELRDQTIRPYSDLLLHDMGPELADGYTEGQAGGGMWRTPTLWGIGLSEAVMDKEGKVGYLHDGRARNLTEAIMWHGGEAAAARNRFAKLNKAQRDELMAFLRSL
ncbi:thiol oxidoreductase [Massilia aurea]|uniref:Thiol oxidoreductase n=2 Tax=Massilia aurea TaxID=373040 RepID=A0A422QNT1_9BURK|nr:thiol oxidoreductase [Massilia aurea]